MFNTFFSKRCVQIATIISLISWLIAQLILIVHFWEAPLYSDAANYAQFAREAVEASSWYPTVQQFNENYWIANTGYINFLAANLYIFGSLHFVAIEQLILNALLLYSLWKLTNRFGGDIAGQFMVILFCLLPSNITVVPALMSDLLCMALIFFSIALLNRNPWVVALCGVLMILGNWVRPIAVVFLPSIILYAIIRRIPIKLWISYFGGMVIPLCLILVMTNHSCGHPLAGSTTKGANMIIGCWDGADGGYGNIVFEPQNPGNIIFSTEMNVVEKDSEMTKRSLNWIISNPGKFIKLIPMKMVRLWIADTYADKVMLSDDRAFSNNKRMLYSLPYYFILLLGLYGLWRVRKELLGIPGLILLPIILGSGMHILMYGGMRYHYPMMPCVLYFAALGLCYLVGLGIKNATFFRINTRALARSSAGNPK